MCLVEKWTKKLNSTTSRSFGIYLFVLITKIKTIIISLGMLLFGAEV